MGAGSDPIRCQRSPEGYIRFIQDLEGFSLGDYQPFSDVSSGMERLVDFMSAALTDTKQRVTESYTGLGLQQAAALGGYLGDPPQGVRLSGYQSRPASLPPPRRWPWSIFELHRVGV